MIDSATYQRSQSLITANMLALLVRLMRKFGIPLTPQAREQFAQRLFPDVQVARGQSYVLATRYMEHSAAAAREPLPDIAPIAPYDSDALVQVLERTTEPVLKLAAALEQLPAQARSLPDLTPIPKVSMLDRRTGAPLIDLDDDPSSPRVIYRIGHETGAAVARHAYQAGRDAITRSADVAGSQVGWARVTTSPTPCGWCAMLASRGPVYKSKATASFLAHDHCFCRVELVFRGHPWDGEEQWQQWQGLWVRSTKGEHGKGAIRAFRRAVTAKNRAHHEHVRQQHLQRAREMFPRPTSADLRRPHHH